MTPEDVQRILDWPPETRSAEENRRLAEYRSELHREMWHIADFAESFDRALSSDEQARYDELQSEFERAAVQVPSRR